MAKAKKQKQNEITFTENELNSLQELKQGFERVQNQLGSLQISKLNLTAQLDTIDDETIRLESQYLALREKEQTMVNELNEKYGAGNLDPASGVFTPKK
tara:strand:+ start:225 stop:521 length:297 start_codon:yes stop_codon:yes gene_type:complete